MKFIDSWTVAGTEATKVHAKVKLLPHVSNDKSFLVTFRVIVKHPLVF